MIDITTNDTGQHCNMQNIGYQAESLRTRVRISLEDFADIVSEYPDGTYTLAYKREGDKCFFVSENFEVDGDALIWTVESAALAVKGVVEVQVAYASGSIVSETRIYKYRVRKSLFSAHEAPKTFIDLLSSALTALNEAIERAHIDLSGKADKTDTVLNTTLSRGRTENTDAGEASIAFGLDVVADGNYAQAFGSHTRAQGDNSHAEGLNTQAQKNDSHAEGYGTIAGGFNSHAEGASTQATGDNSHTEGAGSKSLGANAHAEGSMTLAQGVNSHAEGSGTFATADNSHSEGANTQASGVNAHVEGARNIASGANSHAEGVSSTASGDQSHAEGSGGKAIGNSSHAEGSGTTAQGSNSHAEGGGTSAQGSNSHAEGSGTQAIGVNAHAEGGSTFASGSNSHAEGVGTLANGHNSHAEGYYTVAFGDNTHVEGAFNNTANTSYIPAWHSGTEYKVNEVVRRNNLIYICKVANSDSTFTSRNWLLISGSEKVFAIGNGANADNNRDAFAVLWDGTIVINDEVVIREKDIKELLRNLLELDCIPDTNQVYTFDADDFVIRIDHNRDGNTIRTDSFVYGDESITETRILNATGERLTIVTDLTTYAKSVTYATAS